MEIVRPVQVHVGDTIYWLGMWRTITWIEADRKFGSRRCDRTILHLGHSGFTADLTAGVFLLRRTPCQ